MLLVTGGSPGLGAASSLTEVYNLSLGVTFRWRYAGELPSPRWGLRSAVLGGVIHVSGGQQGEGGDLTASSEVLSWNSTTEAWDLAGRMDRSRYLHALTVAPSFCTPSL